MCYIYDNFSDKKYAIDQNEPLKGKDSLIEDDWLAFPKSQRFVKYLKSTSHRHWEKKICRSIDNRSL